MEAIEYWREKIRRGEYAPVDEGLKDSLGKLKKKVKGVVDKVTAALKKDAEECGKNSPEYCFVRMYCFIKQELEQNNGKLHRPTVRAELYKIAA